MQKADLPVKEIQLDLRNYRTVPQRDELQAIEAMLDIAPVPFQGLMKSIIENGIIPIENIIVIRNEERDKFTVKEGNRRIAALKLALGIIPHEKFELPSSLIELIKRITPEWKRDNSIVSCLVYDASESEVVNRIVSVTHGKGEQAARDPWPSVATARHNRDKNQATQLDLDLLEKYLASGRNLSLHERARWSGDFPLTVLDEAIKRIFQRFGCATPKAFIASYPDNLANRTALENLIYAIGTNDVGFKHLRGSWRDLESRYGIPTMPSAAEAAGGTANANPTDIANSSPPIVTAAAGTTGDTTVSAPANATPETDGTRGSAPAGEVGSDAVNDTKAVGGAANAGKAGSDNATDNATNGPATAGKASSDAAANAASDSATAGKASSDAAANAASDSATARNASSEAANGTTAIGDSATEATASSNGDSASAGKSRPKKGPPSSATNDPRAVTKALKKFRVHGNNREKVAVLLEEMKRIQLKDHPHAFCFLLRSVFEISAKIYCDQQEPKISLYEKDKPSREKSLATLINDVVQHMTKDGKDKNTEKLLHGALTELRNPDRFLSVTSMNQLVHNPNFTIDPSHVSTVFFSIFPLLKHLNS